MPIEVRDVLSRIRARYVQHAKTVKSIGGIELVDVYFVLLVASYQINSTDVNITIPINWINKGGGMQRLRLLGLMHCQVCLSSIIFLGMLQQGVSMD